MTVPVELFELKVIVEAEDWQDISAVMTTVDRALDAHRGQAEGDRQWSVVANRLLGEHARELLWFVERAADRDVQIGAGDRTATTDRVSA